MPQLGVYAEGSVKRTVLRPFLLRCGVRCVLHWRRTAAATSQMITAYVTCLIFGGVLTLASFVTGSDADADHGLPHDAHPHEATHMHGSLLPFLSVRFWMFAVTFFGLVGTGLTLLAAGGAGLIAASAASFGVGAGYCASHVLQSLSRAQVGLLGDAASHVGREAKLLLPLSRQQRGKVRLNIGGISTDLVAETESEEPLPVGSNVLVVAIRGTVALVEPVPGNPILPHKEPSA